MAESSLFKPERSPVPTLMATLRLAPAPTFRWSSSDYALNGFAIQIRAFGPLIEATEPFPAALTAIEARRR